MCDSYDIVPYLSGNGFEAISVAKKLKSKNKRTIRYVQVEL